MLLTTRPSPQITMPSSLQPSRSFTNLEDEYTALFNDDYGDIDFENVPGMQATVNREQTAQLEETARGRSPRSPASSSHYGDFPDPTSSFLREVEELENKAIGVQRGVSPCESFKLLESIELIGHSI